MLKRPVKEKGSPPSPYVGVEAQLPLQNHEIY